MSRTFVLSQSDVRTIVDSVGIDRLMDELIDRLWSAWSDFDPGQTEIPIRQGFSYDEPVHGLLEWMPLYQHGSQVLMKLVAYHPDNPTVRRLPTILSNVSLYDTSTGHLAAMLDGTFLTALRTGAASAVATRLLAHSGSEVIGLIGCGAQSVTQLHAMCRELPVCKVLINDIDPDTEASFRDRATYLDGAISVNTASPDEIVSTVDVLCVQTSIRIGDGPVFSEQATVDHLHINAVGSDFPGKCELPLELLQRAMVVPDCQERAVLEGECQQLNAGQIGPELHQILRDQSNAEPMRSSLTVFDSTGWALQDLVAVQLLLERAAELQVGSRLQVEAVNADPKNPYALSPGIASSSVIGQARAS